MSFAFLFAGLLGALTTFSTFSLETVQLLGQGNYFYAFSNLVLNIFCTLIATLLGIYLTRSLLF